MTIQEIIRIRKELFKANKPSKLDIEPNPCWDGYEPIGLQPDGSPNCVPIKEEQSKEKFIIPSPEKDEEQDKYISRCISSIIDEYGQEQASGICYGQWENRVS